jgi:hypothetical protein
MFDEFSVMKMFAGLVQVLVVFLIAVSLWFLLAPEKNTELVYLTLAYAGIFQLMAIAFYNMRNSR